MLSHLSAKLVLSFDTHLLVWNFTIFGLDQDVQLCKQNGSNGRSFGETVIPQWSSLFQLQTINKAGFSTLFKPTNADQQNRVQKFFSSSEKYGQGCTLISVKVCAARRRRVHTDSETYVLLEPGEDEKFVTEEELRVKLKGWLENWPAKNLPSDLARYESIDDAVT
ncbi:hypothetical protein ACLB2K_054295 [Fragaria x ananassa]